MKISVIIPTYKPSKYLWECLNSLKAQTFCKNDFEIILILNGCKEPYASEINHYLSDQFFGYNIVYIQTDESGVSNARNLGLENAKGEYICFIDDDDFVSENYLEELYSKANINIISICKPIAFNDEDYKVQPYVLTDLFNKLYNTYEIPYMKARRFFIGPCMKLMHRSIIQNKEFDTRFQNGEDGLFMFLVSNKFETIKFTTPSAIYFRRYRKNSAVTRVRSYTKKITNSINLIRAYSKIYFKNAKKYNIIFYIRCILGTLRTIL